MSDSATSPATADLAPAPNPPCLNCEAPLVGPFCSACGQPVVDLAAPTWDVVRDTLAEVTELDGRLRRTMRALVTPGALTAEYLRGRRAPYLTPLKVFLAAGTVLTSTWILTRGVDTHFYGLPPAGDVAGTYIKTVVRGFLAAGIAIAATSWCFALGRRRVVDETVFALHVVAGAALITSGAIWVGTVWKLLWGTVAVVPERLPALPFLFYLPAALLVIGYVMAASRRVHGGAWWTTLARALGFVGAGAAMEMFVLSTGVFR